MGGRNFYLNFNSLPLLFPVMPLEFTKMDGAGNDFVLIDGRGQMSGLSHDHIVRLCDRHRGIGADGVIILRPCTSGKADWAWEFYNRDGSVGEMCGNGARCFARFVQKCTGAQRDFKFETGAGVVSAHFDGPRVTISLTDPKEMHLGMDLKLADGVQAIHSLDTGVPHAVLFVSDVAKVAVQKLGTEIRHHSHFSPRGTNVNFVQVLGAGRIRVRTFERGVEDETLACGTGVTASALVAARVHRFASPINVRVQGGDELEVSFRENSTGFKDVLLTGPADFVFEGRVAI
jgi:diaminopimelate epimerase